MPERPLGERIERTLAQAGLYVAVEADGDRVLLSGRVASDRERQAALDLARSVAGGQRVEDNLEVDLILPRPAGGLTDDDPSPTDLPDTVAEAVEAGEGLEPDFTDQPLFTDPSAAAGASGSASEDLAQEGDEVYYPPTDPVVTTDRHGQAQVLGGFSAGSLDEVDVARSALDGRLGDEAIADAIRQELLEDAMTTDLRVEVVVRAGIAHLKGEVATVDDAEQAETVAARVPGVLEVRETLKIVGF